MMMIPCENCGADNRALHITYPHPNPIFCSECKSERTPSTIEIEFCSWDCLVEWAKVFQSSASTVKKNE